MGTTVNYNWPFPGLNESPNGPVEIQALAQAADATVKGIADDAAAATTPNAIIEALYGDFREQFIQPSVAVKSITSAAYVPVQDASNNVIVGRTFTAPPSGSVWVHYGMSTLHPAGQSTTVTIQVNTGTVVDAGGVQVAASDTNAFSCGTGTTTSNDTDPGAHECLITGLTAGSDYNVFVMWKTSGGTAAAAHPFLSVKAFLA